MSRRRVAALVLLAGACAQVEPPPGGPDDRVAPRVLVTRPDTLAVVPNYRGAVTLVFDERVSEQGVEDAVSVSPRTSGVRVDHSGSEIRVSLVRGWEPGQIYQIRVEPGLRDLFGNATTTATELVFSTGPAIPDTRLAGTVVSRTTGERVVAARVEAIRAPDSLVYAARTDSAGAFLFTRIPEGEYLVRAFSDVNRNRALDVFEARDTGRVRVAVGTEAGPVALRTLAPDTTAPRPGSAELEGGVVRVVFDDFLDPAQPVRPAQVRVIGPDSVAVPVTEVRVGLFPPAPTAGDSAAAPADSARPGRPAAADSTPAVAAADTLPSRTLSIRVGAPLLPSAQYRVVVEGVRNINGLVGGGESPLRTPAPPPAPAAPATPAGDTVRPRPVPSNPTPGARPGPFPSFSSPNLPCPKPTRSPACSPARRASS